MGVPWRLAAKHLAEHWLRSLLTLVAVGTAAYLYCLLVSIVTSLDAAVKESAAQRLFTQSAVSLFVDLPLSYQEKIAAVPGVERVSKMQWFGGYYQEPSNWLAEFGIDHEHYFDMYEKDIEIVEGPRAEGMTPREAALAALRTDRRGAIVGEALRREFGFQVGDSVPLIPTIFQKRDGSEWEFVVVGIYRPLRSNVDARTMFFRYDYLEETLKADLATGPRGTGVYVSELERGCAPDRAIEKIDALFANGPQATLTFTEAAFQAGFLSMLGNLPMFLGSIGGAVVFAVFFSVLNTMLMAARQRTHEVGILKALGFSDLRVALLMLGESVMLTVTGSGAGVAVALLVEPLARQGLGAFIANFHISGTTLLAALGIGLGLGLVAGFGPAAMLHRLQPVAALRSEG